jgi:hypothetical protein
MMKSAVKVYYHCFSRHIHVQEEREGMDQNVKRYYQLKKKYKEIEQELSDLRNEILACCAEMQVSEAEISSYKVKIIAQNRKEYDDDKLYAKLPDPGIWRLLSKADPAKVAGLLKLNVITEQMIRETFTIKQISLLQVEKR